MRNGLKHFDKVYKEQCTAVYHTALVLLKDSSAAEDVMQDVFLTYYRALEQGQEVKHLRAWLLTCTRNRCYNELRDHRREEPTEEISPLVVQEDPLADLQQQDVVERLLAGLSSDERMSFSLHYLDGYTYHEIAAGLDVPVGTVQTRCRLARKKLRAALHRMNDGEERLV